jgi:hypothetical protein
MSTALAQAQAAAVRVSEIVGVLPLDTLEHEAQAAELLRALATVRARAEEARKIEKAPHLDAGRAVDDRYRDGLAELDRVAGLLKSRLAEKALAREAEARRLRAEAAAAASVEVANAALAQVQDAPSLAGVSARHSWELDAITDWRAVPVEYLSIDMVRVRAACTAASRAGAEPVIPGLRFKRAVVVSARRVSE